MEKFKDQFLFRAINQYTEINIVVPTEKETPKGFITWGENNDYPQYLDTLYNTVPTIKSIIDGTTDFICGNGIICNNLLWSKQINDKQETLEDLVRNLSRDYLKYGGFAINIVRNRIGEPVSLYYIPYERLRSNKDNTEFYYSTEWEKSLGRVKYAVYPKYNKEDRQTPSSIFYYSSNKTNTYPSPSWGAATTSAEIEKRINDFHLNSICNGFSASYLISMNNGIPTEEQADEIEQEMIEKFTGSGNGGRLAINFAPDKDHAIELSKLDTDDAGEKYKTLAERSKQEIFTAFRALPQLFGINLNTGFSTQEYEDAFKLYNRTKVIPIQRIITQSINNIIDDTLEIKPFAL